MGGQRCLKRKQHLYRRVLRGPTWGPTTKLLEEIEVEVRSSGLSISHNFHPCSELFRYEIGYDLVFNVAKGGWGDVACRGLFPRFKKVSGPEVGARVVVTQIVKGCGCRHICSERTSLLGAGEDWGRGCVLSTPCSQGGLYTRD